MMSQVLPAFAAIHFSVMTFNIENGGTQVDFNKVVEAIKKSNADVVGIQEAWGHTAKLAKAVGWKYYNSNQHIISRFPLYVPDNDQGLYTFIEIQKGKIVALANIHLPSDPYGPTLVLNHALKEKVIHTENRVRLSTALPYINKVSSLLMSGVPVFITGDFNSPSHLDWTVKTVNQLPAHRYAVIWPVTKMIEDKGFVDSFRIIYPDPLKNIAYTWPAGRPMIKNAIDGFNPSKNDFPERIDFIFAGNAKVIESHIVAEPGYGMSDIHVSPWPSDHRALVSRFEVSPVALPINIHQIIVPSKHIVPTLKVSSSVHSGEPIRISWNHAPGNRFDYIRIVPVHSTKLGWDDVARLYINGSSHGSINYDQSNVAGNRPEWCQFFQAKWPLKPGTYEVSLMLDDSLTALASTQFTIR